MFKKYALFFLATLILLTFSSCGFIKMDFSVAADQFTDFSPKEEPPTIADNDSLDCGCYGPRGKGPCNKMYAPVCGCDGITYDNKCFAILNGIYIYTRGSCGTPVWTESYPKPSSASPPIVNPVPTISPEAKPWPANPRPPANNKPPQI